MNKLKARKNIRKSVQRAQFKREVIQALPAIYAGLLFLLVVSFIKFVINNGV